MKKFFTLAVALLSVSAAVFAQPGYKGDDRNRNDDRYASSDRGRDNDRFNNGRGKDYYFTDRERDMQIAKINRDFDARLQSLNRKFFLFPGEKKKQYRQLQNDRAREINRVNDYFNDWRNQFTKKRGRW